MNNTIKQVDGGDEPGLVGKMLMFLRSDLGEISAVTNELRHTSDGLFGVASEGSVLSPSGVTPSHAAGELTELMQEVARARCDLHDEVQRLTRQL